METELALRIIGEYLRTHASDFPSIDMDALIEAMTLIMKYNIFKFGDTWWRQISGTAMGTPPAPAFATLFFAIFEDAILDQFMDWLFEYLRYIDDVFGLWVPDPDPAMDEFHWRDFKRMMNEESGLEWVFTERSDTIDFLDLTITISDGAIRTTLYEKKLDLYLCIPPHSAHPPGVLTGLVLGGIHRIYNLCSDDLDIESHLKRFYHRLIMRGYKRTDLEPHFVKGIEKHRARRQNPSPVTEEVTHCLDDNLTFLHLQFNPGNPPSHALQKLWQETVAAPRGRTKLQYLTNSKNVLMGTRRMVVAYSRTPNLGNLLSYRRLPSDGPPASSFLD
jgi:hypothetical protein